jgi:antitoxin component YwqK of YwqJK toxin-antitoxin module
MICTYSNDRVQGEYKEYYPNGELSHTSTKYVYYPRNG